MNTSGFALTDSAFSGIFKQNTSEVNGSVRLERLSLSCLF